MHNRGPATFKEYSRSDFTLIPLIIQMFAQKKKLFFLVLANVRYTDIIII